MLCSPTHVGRASGSGTARSARTRRTVSLAADAAECCSRAGLAILTSFNRNFKARNDGNRKTMNFLASPDIVTAMVRHIPSSDAR